MCTYRGVLLGLLKVLYVPVSRSRVRSRKSTTLRFAEIVILIPVDLRMAAISFFLFSASLLDPLIAARPSSLNRAGWA